jgi:hypothetical protein
VADVPPVETKAQRTQIIVIVLVIAGLALLAILIDHGVIAARPKSPCACSIGSKLSSSAA